MIAIILLIIGGLNWGLVILNYNLIHEIALITHNIFEIIIYGLICISAIYMMFKRDTYLPFLGHMAYPCNNLVSHIPNNADKSIFVKVLPNTSIVYWGSEKTNNHLKNLPDPRIAYHLYENTGIVISDENGNAELKFRDPQQYVVPSLFGKKILDKHIHYRYCIGNGLLSPIFTVSIK
jgi:uncharacterized membrane protein YuzA (DUF378 family)